MEKRDEVEINLSKLIKILWKKLPLILLITVVFAVVAFFYFRSPSETTYTAQSSFFVENTRSVDEEQISLVDDGFSINHTTQRNTQTIKTICYVASSQTTLQAVINENALPYSTQELSTLVSITSADNINAFSVNVKSSSEYEALQIAHAFANTLPDELAFLSPSAELRVLDYGSVTGNTSGGNNIKKTILFAFVVAFLIVCVYTLKYIVDEVSGNVTLNAADLTILFPQVRLLSRSVEKGFDQEAINRLRSMLLLSFEEKPSSCILGVTAPNEEKERNSFIVDLTKSVARLGKKTILIDADLRSHTLSDILNGNQENGLSDILSASATISECIQRGSEENNVPFAFLSAGNNLDGHAEKLLSSQMQSILQALREEYDFIVLNMTEIETEIDAASIGKATDGNVVFLCEDHCTRNQLTYCLEQLRYASAPVLGFAVAKP